MNRSESRYFATAARMDEAFLTLLAKKDFEYITVKEICEVAEVNRSTFYLHYETMSDLYHVLITVDRLTLQIVLMKIQGYSTHEIARYLKITEKAVYRHMDRLKEKVKKIFE